MRRPDSEFFFACMVLFAFMLVIAYGFLLNGVHP